MLKIICVVLFGLLPAYTWAQFNQVSIYPPEAASLMRNVDFPVGHLNGMPDIRIPLYTIKSGSLTLPLEISFHIDNYIRANQMPGSVGAGWSLSSELQVSRTINGKDDLRPEGYCSTSTIPSNYYSAYVPYQQRTRQQMKYMVDGYADEEPDKFYYQLLGKSGSFYFQKQPDGSFKPIPVPFNGVKIEYSNGQFKIVDTDGTKYTFSGSKTDWTDDGPAVTHLMDWKCESINNAAGSLEFTFTHAYSYQYMATSFSDRLEVYDNINSYMGFEPEFGILSNPEGWGGSLTLPFWQITGPKSLKYAGQYSSLLIFNPQTSSFQDMGNYGEGTPSQSLNNITNYQTSQITFRGGSVVFTYTPNTNSRQLSLIQVKNENGTIIKTINFSQSYIGSPGGLQFSTNKYEHSRKLYMLQIDDQKYSFSYGFDRQYGNISDFWGYEAGPPLNYCTVPYQQINLSMGNCIRWYDGSAFDPFDPYISLIPMIGEARNLEMIFGFNEVQRTAMSITYPTGGKTEFIVGQNRFRDPIDETIKGTGGYRIEKIRHFDGINPNPVKEKIYKYGPNEDGTGIIKSMPSFDPYSGNCFLDETNTYVLADGTELNSTRKRTYLSGSTRSLTFSNGAPVNYNEVAEYDSDMGQFTGKTVYKYDIYNYSPEYTSPTDPFPLERNDWDIAMPDSVINYKYQNGHFNWVKRKNMDYHKFTDPYQIFCGRASLRGNYIMIQPQTSLTQDWLTEFKGNLEYKFKGIETGVMQLVSEDEAERGNNGNIITTRTNYFYNNPDPSVVSRIENTGSDGVTTIQNNIYPRDYASGGFTDYLITNNIVSAPVEKITRRNGKVVSGQISIYNSNGTVATTYQIESNQLTESGLKLSNRAVIGDYSPASANVAFNADQVYVPKFTIDWDNTYLNPLQVSPSNNIPTSYIWGYNQTYPVVKIEGVAYGDISSSIKTNISGRAFTSSTNYFDVKTDVDYLKAQLASIMSDSRYMITFYTYSPLVGMTSQTDPNGLTTYYEYDTFGRLKNAKDKDQKILKHYQYHYYNEQ